MTRLINDHDKLIHEQQVAVLLPRDLQHDFAPCCILFILAATRTPNKTAKHGCASQAAATTDQTMPSDCDVDVPWHSTGFRECSSRAQS